MSLPCPPGHLPATETISYGASCTRDSTPLSQLQLRYTTFELSPGPGRRSAFSSAFLFVRDSYHLRLRPRYSCCVRKLSSAISRITRSSLRI